MHLESLSFMGHARDLLTGSLQYEQSRLNLVIPGDSLAVRRALKTVRDTLAQAGIRAESQSAAQIVIAEVLNNVVEHAYSDRSGVVELNLKCDEQAVRVEILDEGHPMPANTLPAGQAYDLTQMQDDLPEGGFGWFMIRELAQELQYLRQDRKNKLSFSIPASRAQ